MRARMACSPVVLSLVLAVPLWSQVQPEADIVTVTTWQMPFDKVDEFFQFLDKNFLVMNKENPYIVGFKYLSHNWGDADQTVWLLTEYRELGDITKAEKM
jgi:hypothetical protein